MKLSTMPNIRGAIERSATPKINVKFLLLTQVAHLKIFQVSATTGTGLENWYQWLGV